MKTDAFTICRFLGLRPSLYEARLASLLRSVSETSEPSLGEKFMMKMFESMNFGRQFHRDAFMNYSRLTIGVADSILADRIALIATDPGVNVNSQALKKMFYNLFNNTGYRDIAGRADRDVAGEVIPVNSALTKFLMYREFIPAFMKYTGANPGNLASVDTSRLDGELARFVRSLDIDGYVTGFRHNNAMRQTVKRLVGYITPSEITGLRSIALQKGQMSALLEYIRIFSGADARQYEQMIAPLVSARNAIAHEGTDSGHPDATVGAVRSFVEIMCMTADAEKLPLGTRLASRARYCLLNPGEAVAALVSTAAMVALPLIAAAAVLFAVCMAGGDSDVKRIKTVRLSDIEKVKYYEALASKDTTAILDLHHKVNWINRNMNTTNKQSEK